MSYEDIDQLTEARASIFAFSETDSQRILFPPNSALPVNISSPLPQRLEQLKKRETRYNLHGATLSQYWRNKRIPRGLRINKEPTIGRDDEMFCKKWCEILNKCSLDLILLVIEHVNDDLSKTRNEMSDLQKQLSSQYDETQLKAITDRCDALLEKYKNELTEMKLRKYRRDTLDYKSDQVYRWLSTPRRRPRPNSNLETDPSSSGLSTDESGPEGASAGNASLFLSTRRGRGRPQSRNIGRRGEGAGDTRNRGKTRRHPTY